MGAWVSGGISGGHLNPAVSSYFVEYTCFVLMRGVSQVTLALASWRGFPRRKVPGKPPIEIFVIIF